MTDLIAGADPRFNESRQAVKALVAVMYTRFPDHVSTIDAWFDGYVDVLCGVMTGQKPTLSAEQILDVGREVMNGWSNRQGKFPRPNDFIELREERLKAKWTNIQEQRSRIGQFTGALRGNPQALARLERLSQLHSGNEIIAACEHGWSIPDIGAVETVDAIEAFLGQVPAIAHFNAAGE